MLQKYLLQIPFLDNYNYIHTVHHLQFRLLLSLMVYPHLSESGQYFVTNEFILMNVFDSFAVFLLSLCCNNSVTVVAVRLVESEFRLCVCVIVGSF